MFFVLLAACAPLHIEPAGALDGATGPLLVVVTDLTPDPPPSLMLNAKAVSASFEAHAVPDAVCAALVRGVTESGATFGPVACRVGAPDGMTVALGQPLGVKHTPSRVLLPAAGTVFAGDPAPPPFVLLLGGVTVGYVPATGDAGEPPRIAVSATTTWWSDAAAAPVAWGYAEASADTGGWLTPQRVGDDVDRAVAALAKLTLQRAGLAKASAGGGSVPK